MMKIQGSAGSELYRSQDISSASSEQIRNAESNAESQNTDTVEAYQPQSGLQLLGGGAEQNETPVSESYAAQSDSSNQASSMKSEGYSAIRSEIAGALGVAENNPAVDAAYQELVITQQATQESARLEMAQGVIDEALQSGRRIEQTVKFGDMEGTTFTEIVPSPSGDLKDAVVRTGTELTEHGFFGDTTNRITTYHDASGRQIGVVESLIEGGEEKITKVIEYEPGAIALKPGDTRTLGGSTTTAAGKAPSTWDPQPDGRYGSTSGSSSSNTGSSTNTGNTNEGGVNAGEGVYHGETGGTSGASSSGNSEPVTSEETGRTWSTTTDDNTKWDGNSGQSTERTTSTTTEFKNSDGSYTYKTDTTVTTTDENGEQTSTTTTTSETTNTQKEYYAWDAADTGPALPAETGVLRDKTTASGSGGGYTAAESRPAFTADGKSLLQDTSGYADKPGGPTDYGNASDPNANPEIFDFDLSTVMAHIGPDPTVTDPGQGEGGPEAATLEGGSIKLDMAGTLRDGGNPLDPNVNEAPSGEGPPSTDPYSHND